MTDDCLFQVFVRIHGDLWSNPANLGKKVDKLEFSEFWGGRNQAFPYLGSGTELNKLLLNYTDMSPSSGPSSSGPSTFSHSASFWRLYNIFSYLHMFSGKSLVTGLIWFFKILFHSFFFKNFHLNNRKKKVNCETKIRPTGGHVVKKKLQALLLVTTLPLGDIFGASLSWLDSRLWMSQIIRQD